MLCTVLHGKNSYLNRNNPDPVFPMGFKESNTSRSCLIRLLDKWDQLLMQSLSYDIVFPVPDLIVKNVCSKLQRVRNRNDDNNNRFL